MKTKADRLVDDYLKRLNRELTGLPRRRRRELTDEIAGHIAEARADLETENEVEIRNLLERLGDPAEIALEERSRRGVQPRRAGLVEVLALTGLLVGGFFAFVGWFVGLVCLWLSDAWTTGEKLFGTFVVPGGLMPAFLLYGEAFGGSPVGFGFSKATATALFTVCLIGPFFTTIFLARRMKRPASVVYHPSSGAA